MRGCDVRGMLGVWLGEVRGATSYHLAVHV